MALQFANRVKETSSTTGTGSLTLSGATAANYRTFANAFADGTSTYYAIVSQSAGEWEVGIGVYSNSSNSISRVTVLESSNSNSLVNFSAGTKEVFCTPPAQYMDLAAAPAAVSSASTVSLGTIRSSLITINGSTPITSLGTADAGITRRVLFSAALTLAHNATSLILPSSANITTAANDSALFLSLGSGNWLCVSYSRGNGKALTTPTSGDIATALGFTPAHSGANSDVTSLGGLTGPVQSPTFIQMGDGSATSLAAGRFWYDPSNGSWNAGMGNGNITQQIGEEIFVYGKASAAITEGQLVVKTGTVGASGVITFGPAPAALTDSTHVVGVATENISLNGFGRVTAFGVVHGITTTGAASGETWADSDDLWYNPAGGGLLTKVRPNAPNIKCYVGEVIKAGSGGSGSIQVRIVHGSTLGSTDSNVLFTSIANNHVMQYDSATSLWKNRSLNSDTVVEGSTNLFYTDTRVRAAISGTAPMVYNQTTGNFSMFQASNLSSGYLAQSDWVIFNGKQDAFGTQTANKVYASPNGASGNASFRALVAADIPTLNQNTTGIASFANNLSGGTTGSVPYQSGVGTTSLLAPGTDGFVLTMSSGSPAWVNPADLAVAMAIALG